MHGQVALLGLLLVGLLLATFFYFQSAGLLTSAQEETDVYLRFSRLAQAYAKLLSGEYNIYESNGLVYLYVRTLLVNEGTTPIYYRSPLLAIVRAKDANGQTVAIEVYLSADNATSAFYPSVIYKLSGMTTLDSNAYRPYRVDLLLNSISLSTTLEAVPWLQPTPVHYCYTCSGCQKLIDSLSSGTIYVDSNVTVDRDPCITFSGEKNIVLDCGGHTFSGSGTETAFFFNGASGIELKSCRVENVDKAIEINGENPSKVTGVAVSSARYAVYLENPLDTSSYAIDLQDVMYNDKKLYYFKPGYGTSFSPFLPFAIWVYGVSIIDVNVGGSLEAAHPLIAVVNSKTVELSNFSLTTTAPYAIVLYSSYEVNILDANITASGDYALYASLSDLRLDRVNLEGIPLWDLYLLNTDVWLDDVNIG